MDSKDRIRLIRERHRKVILEPRRRIQYDPLQSWDDEPLFDDDALATRFAQVDDIFDDE
jgi:hypothetical protein